MKALDVVVGLAIGAGLFVSIAVGLGPGEKPAPALDVCYQLVSVRPEAHLAITFNACTGRFGLSQLPPGVTSPPGMHNESAQGSFVKPNVRDSI